LKSENECRIIPARFEYLRAHFPWLATGLASIKIKIPIGDRRFLSASCEELQLNSIFFKALTVVTNEEINHSGWLMKYYNT
jgi:hypothetical protein